MKFIIVCFLSFGLWSVSAKGIDSKVESVTIFLNQAQVSRSSNIAIGPETKQLVFTGLSSMLDPNSVQVKGQGDFYNYGDYVQAKLSHRGESSGGCEITQGQNRTAGG